MNGERAPVPAVRVFVSSAFHGLGAERDALVKGAFPALRRLCEARGTSLAEIDLRWGITDDEAADGRVLPLCLAEIDRCRPFFLGILAGRYGSILPTFPAGLLAENPWLAAYPDRSLSEIEMRHGALNDPAAAPYAFFYIRSNREPAGPPEGVDAKLRLQALESEIRKTFPARDYANPDELAQQVQQDLERVFLDLLAPVPATVWEREALAHRAYVSTRHRVFLERPGVFKHLDHHVRADSPPLVIVGEEGSGKSSLVAGWLRSRTSDEAPKERGLLASMQRWVMPPGVRKPLAGAGLVFHFAEATELSSWEDLAHRLLGELGRLLGDAREVPENPDALRSHLASRFSEAAAKGRIIVLIDGLDRIDDRNETRVLSWLPERIPSRLRLILTCRPGPIADEAIRRRWNSLQVLPLLTEERRQLAELDLGDYGKRLGPSHLSWLARTPQAGNPLYLRTLLRELRTVATHDALTTSIERYLEAETPAELFRRILQRLETDLAGQHPGFVADALGLLASARRGLAENEVLELLRTPEAPHPAVPWSSISLALGDALASHSGVLTFAHQSLRQAVEELALREPVAQIGFHERLIAYFTACEPTEHKIEELPWHLASVAGWDRLEALWSDLSFLSAAWSLDPVEVKRSWALLEKNGQRSMATTYRSVLERPEDHPQHAGVVGLLLRQTGNPTAPLGIFHFLVTAAERDRYPARLQAALGNLALVLRSAGEPAEALALLRSQEDLCRQLGDRRSLQACLGNQGVLLREAEDAPGALARHEEEGTLCRDLGDLGGLAASLCNQAGALYAQHRVDEAEARLREAEEICRTRGDLTGLQACLGSLGEVLRARGNLANALARHREEESLCRSVHDREGLQWSLLHQASVLQEMRDFDGALAKLREQRKIAQELGSPGGLAAGLASEALFWCNFGAPSEAAQLAGQAAVILKELPPGPQMRETKELLGRAFAAGAGRAAPESRRIPTSSPASPRTPRSAG